MDVTLTCPKIFSEARHVENHDEEEETSNSLSLSISRMVNGKKNRSVRDSIFEGRRYGYGIEVFL
jgi:hypothetical protein